MRPNLLTRRTYRVSGHWYEPSRFLERYKSVRKVFLYDKTSSAGDWNGYFIQQLGKRYYLIPFSQKNNYPGEGFTLRTHQRPFITAGSVRDCETVFQSYLESLYVVHHIEMIS